MFLTMLVCKIHGANSPAIGRTQHNVAADHPNVIFITNSRNSPCRGALDVKCLLFYLVSKLKNDPSITSSHEKKVTSTVTDML